MALRAVRRGLKLTPVFLTLHILVHLAGVSVAAAKTYQMGVSFITPEWIARAILFIVGVPLLLWGGLWLLALGVFVLWEKRQ